MPSQNTETGGIVSARKQTLANTAYHEFAGFSIPQAIDDGYVNITALAKVYSEMTGKRRDVRDWLKSDRVQESIRHLSQKLGIPVAKLVTIHKGEPVELQGTWIHQELREEFYSWLTQKSKKSKEAEIRDKLQREIGGSTEVTIPVGKIDLLTKTEIIEVKNASNCPSAIGQILIYGDYYPNHQKRIHLFGKANWTLLQVFEKQCKNLGIIVTYEN